MLKTYPLQCQKKAGYGSEPDSAWEKNLSKQRKQLRNQEF